MVCGCIHKNYIHNSHFFVGDSDVDSDSDTGGRSVVGRRMGLGRRNLQPDSAVEPPAKILRKSRSLRNMAHELVMGDMLLEKDVESDPTSAELPGSNVEPMESQDNAAREGGEDGHEDEGGAVIPAGEWSRNARVHCDVLDHRQRMLFATSFKLYFGVSDEMLDSLEDLCRVMAPHAAIDSMTQGMGKLTRDAQERFGLQKHFYCVSCDKRLSNSKALCCTEGCELQG